MPTTRLVRNVFGASPLGGFTGRLLADIVRSASSQCCMKLQQIEGSIKMKKCHLPLAIASLALIAGTLSSATYAASGNTQKHETKSGSGSVEVESRGGLAAVPADAVPNFVATGCYDYWWVTGAHTWNYRNFYYTSWNDLSAQTQTSYGSSTGSCNIPVVSDWLRTQGNNRGAQLNAVVDKTAYNVSTSTAYDKVNSSGQSAASVCGAQVTHTAYKSGVQWFTTTKDGC